MSAPEREPEAGQVMRCTCVDRGDHLDVDSDCPIHGPRLRELHPDEGLPICADCFCTLHAGEQVGFPIPARARRETCSVCGKPTYMALTTTSQPSTRRHSWRPKT